MTEQYFADDSFEQELAVSVPLARYGAAADVAKAALFLASDQSGYLTRRRPAGRRRLPRREELRLRTGRLVVPVRERDARLTGRLRR